jgi:hypothetical protein
MQETAIKEGIGKRARFDFIRYANCWEDADILLRALDVKEGGVYLSIASAGDNTLSLLSCNPSLVLAIDLSAAQLACLELRRAAFARLPYEGVLRFLGVRESTDRLIPGHTERPLSGCAHFLGGKSATRCQRNNSRRQIRTLLSFFPEMGNSLHPGEKRCHGTSQAKGRRGAFRILSQYMGYTMVADAVQGILQPHADGPHGKGS